jgi:hypothetical protein
MRDRGLGEAGGRCNVAGADRPVRRELPYDREARRIGQGSQEPDIGVVDAHHIVHAIDELLY